MSEKNMYKILQDVNLNVSHKLFSLRPCFIVSQENYSYHQIIEILIIISIYNIDSIMKLIRFSRIFNFNIIKHNQILH